jgi:hypothetical protein
MSNRSPDKAHEYYLAHKEKMTIQTRVALEKRRANGDRPGPSSYRRKDAGTPERKAKVRGYRLQRTYGMSLQQYGVMLGQQEGCCAICCNPFGEGLPARIDHCHATGKVRSLLCDHCNRGLGDFQDSLATMRKAIAYIEHHYRADTQKPRID